LVLLFITTNAFSQKRESFSRLPEEFLKELENLFEIDRRGSGKELIKENFAATWIQTDRLSEDQREEIIVFCELVLKDKIKLSTELKNYLLAVQGYCNGRASKEKFKQWQSMLNQIVATKSQRKYLLEIIECGGQMFGRQCFYKSAMVDWQIRTDDYNFVLDSVPMLKIGNTRMVCYSKGDSSVLENTSGIYYPTNNRYYANGAVITWERAGFDPTKTYAELGHFLIKVKGTSYSADSAKFHTDIFNEILIGKVTDKILADQNTDIASYPKFESYFARHKIKNIVNNVDYEGGFTLVGTKLKGTGPPGNPARIIVYQKNIKMFEAMSYEFGIKPDRLFADHASILFYIDKDTISHQDAAVNLDKKNRNLHVTRKDEGTSKAPFQNTYHKIEMYVELISWNIDDPQILMGASESNPLKYAAFESNLYFRQNRYQHLFSIAPTNPLIDLRDLTKKLGTKEFYNIDFARQIRFGEEQTHLLLIDLANRGFIDYDVDTRKITVLAKTSRFIDNNIGRRDYDVIQFSSEVDKGHNAQLSLLNFDLTLKGVDNFSLSDSQQVIIQPLKKEVILKKSREFAFGGRVLAGNFEFSGSDYYFKYDQFQLDLLKVDSCKIYIDSDEIGMDGKPEKQKLKSVIRDIAGVLKIDAPSNKGGFHSPIYPKYPILECTKSSFIHWQDKAIQRGAYKKDKFYYQLEPFTIDSLDNFNKSQLNFKGTLISGNIFPDITEPLVLMPDNSLGFKTKTPELGFPTYSGKSKVIADLTLNYSGLQGSGSFEYLTSIALSESFLFLPDSMNGVTNNYLNKELATKPEVPKSHSDTTLVQFYPFSDVLNVTNRNRPIDFFNDEAKLTGTLYLKPSGMSGRGNMEFAGAKMYSENYHFTRRKILADTSDFQLNRPGETSEFSMAFKTNNVNGNVDFDKRLGVFKSNGGETKIEFPANQYVCYMDQFTWYMDKDEMDLSSSRKASDDLVIDTDEEQIKSNFYSVAEGQDSLNFLSPRAKYDIKESKIFCQKIRYIIVADSKITPDSGKVVIEKFAKMQELKNAQVLCNYTTQYHRIYNATLSIKGRRKFDGSGSLNYIDETKKEFPITLNDIRVDTSFQTIAKGKIKEDDQFFLSPAFEYYGEVEVQANNRFLIFDGGVRMLHNCSEMSKEFCRFRSEINPAEIYIPVDTSLRAMDMTKLGVGIMVTGDSPMDIYPAFLSDIRDGGDKSLIETRGYLTFDKNTSRYVIGSKEKIKQPKLAGNLLAINTSSCELTGDGQIDFNVDFGMMKAAAIGDIIYKPTDKSASATGALKLSFPFYDDAIEKIQKQIENWPNLMPVDISKTRYEKALIEILGTETSDKVISELNLTGQVKRTPEALICPFLIADIKFVWNDLDETFQSTGPIGIANMGKKQVFRYIKGKIEIEKKRGADVFRMYVELDPGNWYYFEYKLGIMNFLTSDKDLGNSMSELKDEKRKFEDGKKKFSFMYVANRKKRDDFISRFPDLQ